MRSALEPKHEQRRITSGLMGTSSLDGMIGAFLFPYNATTLTVIVCDGDEARPEVDVDHLARGWEHVSVSTPTRCPTWAEMDFIKNVFWREDEVVMQLHVARADHVNVHPYCLHLWRPRHQAIPLPDPALVGPKL